MYLHYLENLELKKAFATQIKLIDWVLNAKCEVNIDLIFDSIFTTFPGKFGGFANKIHLEFKNKFAKELQLTPKEIDSQYERVDKYIEYLKTDSENTETHILEKVWSEFARPLESAGNPIKKITYFEIFTLIATLGGSDQTNTQSKLEGYCEFLRQKLRISPDIARRLEDIVGFELDAIKHINDTIYLD